MANPLIAGRRYRQPIGFGPSAGPRADQDGGLFKNDRRETVQMVCRFRSSRDFLQSLTPPEFIVEENALASAYVTSCKGIDWLAGRGYNFFGLRWPARHQGKSHVISGEFLPVLWENLADPILTGREELGYPKLFSDITGPTRLRNQWRATAEWEGYRFFEMTLDAGPELALDEGKQRFKLHGEGALVLRHMPGIGVGAEPDAHYPVIAPYLPAEGVSSARITRVVDAQGSFKFNPATWNDMPTQFHIVSQLAEMPVLETVDAALIWSVGGTDLGNARRLDR